MWLKAAKVGLALATPIILEVVVEVGIRVLKGVKRRQRTQHYRRYTR